jgi:hypothetical protein
LERSDGQLRRQSVTVDTDSIDSALNDTGMACHCSSDSCAIGDPFLYACVGGHQGCPLATHGCILPHHADVLNPIAKEFPDVIILGDADDTYYNAPSTVVHAAFARKRELAKEVCGHESNLTKVCAYSPTGDMAGKPDDYGDVCVYKPVGAYFGDPAAVTKKTTERLLKKLSPLKNLNQARDTETANNVAQLKRILITKCAANQSIYTAQTTRPSLARPALAAEQDELRDSWRQLTEADATAERCPRRADLAWRQSLLPESAGGMGLHDTHAKAAACWCASLLRSWRELQRMLPLCAAIDINTSDLPIFKELHKEYGNLQTTRDRVEKTHKEFDKQYNYEMDGSKKTRFHLDSLPDRKYVPDIVKITANENSVPPPQQRTLSAIITNENWHAHALATLELDATATDTLVRHREATRFISVSQVGSGSWLDVAPDSSLPFARQRSSLATIALQRRLGLYISSGIGAAEGEASAEGVEPDYLGDRRCNGGAHGPRHNAVLRAVRDVVAAVATNTVLLGDKEQRDHYQQYNAGYVADLIQPGASPWGTDWLAEIKCPSPLTLSHHAGRGNSKGAGTLQDVGHFYAFGSTEEHLHLDIYGCAKRGRRADGPFNHATGRGYVEAKKGHYDDGIKKKNNMVVAVVVESFGGIGTRAQRAFKFAARRAGDKKRGRDGTKYSRTRPASFLTHHMRQISSAAVITDAYNIEKEIIGIKISQAPRGA